MAGTLATASTLLALEKYIGALIVVSVGGLCTLIVSIIVKLINWMGSDD